MNIEINGTTSARVSAHTLTECITRAAISFGLLMLIAAVPAIAAYPLSYHGGPVLAEFRIYPLYYGVWSDPDITMHQNYLTGLAANMSGQGAPIGQFPMMWQYGVNTVSVAPFARDQRNLSPATLTDAAISYLISDNQALHTLPSYSRTTLIMVFLGKDNLGNYMGLANCAKCGYHYAVSDSAYWAVVPRNAGVGTPAKGGIPVDPAPFQLVTSHEVFEASANPAIGRLPAWDEAVDQCPDGLVASGGSWIQFSFGWIAGATDNTLAGACSTTGYSTSAKMAQSHWYPVTANMVGTYLAPRDAVVGGTASDGTTPLYACRGRRSDGGIQPGNMRSGSTDGCVIGYGTPQAIKSFDVLMTSWEGNVWDNTQSTWVYTVGEVPRNAVQGGYDTSGAPLYYCRGLVSGTWQPGKTRDGFGACNVPYGGRELAASRYQVLVKLIPAVQLGTVAASNGDRPKDAVKGGVDSDGETLFICAASYAGGTHTGKLKPSFHACLVPYGGSEISVSSYSVLVTRWASPGLRSGLSLTFPAGKDTSNDTLYTCRGSFGTATVPGRFKPSVNTCEVGLGGSDVSLTSYEILSGTPTVAP